jgi:cell division protease FtsH
MYGMSEKFGMVALATVQSQYLEGTSGMTCAQETAAAVDREVMAIISSCFSDSLGILEENREMLDKVSDFLLVKETITGQEMMAILAGRDPSLVDNYADKPGLPRVIRMPDSVNNDDGPDNDRPNRKGLRRSHKNQK